MKRRTFLKDTTFGAAAMATLLKPLPLNGAAPAQQKNEMLNILFHEELLVGYVKNLHELEEPLNGLTTRSFQDLLKGTDSLIIYGLTERDGDEYYISAPIVSARGVVANYRKTHLWWKTEGLRHEPTFYKPGNQLVTFDVKGFNPFYNGLRPEIYCYNGLI